ncbi:MAG: outer membrane protein assembly factor BamB [Burkholderiales bacterium]
MISKRFTGLAFYRRSPAAIIFVAAAALLLGACGSGAKKPKPTELGPNASLIAVKPLWSQRLGAVDFSLQIAAQGDTVTLASNDGTVVALDVKTGAERWRASLATALTAGVGSDGKLAAVVTRNNELVMLDGGRELWRQKLAAQVYTAPFVAGGRVFVLAADRSVTAFDGKGGRQLWSQQRPGEPLVLRQAGVMLAVGDTLVVGLSGRLVGMNPLNGSSRWEAPIASPRGVNEVERLVDLVGSVSRVNNVVCARSYQTAVGCVDAQRGNLLWSKPADGAQGVHGDERQVYGSEADGKVLAWARGDGQRVWSNEALRYRDLSAPLLYGRALVVGDAAGFLHFLSPADGSLLTRVSTDGQAPVGAPVQAAGVLVTITRNGTAYGFSTE